MSVLCLLTCPFIRPVIFLERDVGNNDCFWEGNLRLENDAESDFSLYSYLYCLNVLPCAYISSSN